MDKNRIASKIARLERELAAMAKVRHDSLTSARSELNIPVEHLDAHNASNIAGCMAKIAKCNAIISRLESEIDFLKELTA